MMARNTCGSCIEIETLIEGATLLRAVVQLDAGTAPDCPVPSADSITSLQNCDVVTSLSKFIARRESRDSRSKNHDFDSFAGAVGQRRRSRIRAWHGCKAQGLHRDVSSANATQDA